MTSLSYIVGRGCCIVVSVLDVKIRRYCSSIGMIGGCTLDCPWKGNCSTCDDSGNASSDAGASREDSIVFLLNGVTFQLLLVGLLLDIMDYELGLRVIYLGKGFADSSDQKFSTILVKGTGTGGEYTFCAKSISRTLG